MGMGMHTQHRKTYGFTIVELLIVVVVIAILAAITIVSYNGITNRAKVSAAQQGAAQASKKLLLYALDNADQFPSTPDAAGINDGGGTTYQYTFDNTATPKDYCITATYGDTSAYVGAMTGPKPGNCLDNYRLAGWWPMNGNANDQSSNGNNGVVTGATLVAGKNGGPNGAYNFANTSDKISLATSATLNNQVLSLTAWVKTTSGGTIISGPMGVPQLRIDAGKLTLLKAQTMQFTSSTGSVGSNVWTFVGVTYDSQGNFKYYINGTAAGSGTNLQTYTGGLNIIGSNSGMEPFVGSMEDVRVYARVLTSGDMTSLYNAGPQ
jgi:prepilin-type N-terminal cleavage/methylation domain-containing protein